MYCFDIIFNKSTVSENVYYAVSEILLSLFVKHGWGRVALPKRMIFRISSKLPLNTPSPPPSPRAHICHRLYPWRKICHVEKVLFNGPKSSIWIFGLKKTPPLPPLENFPKIRLRFGGTTCPLVCAWCLNMCLFMFRLEVNTLSQLLQGMEISKWFASMCFTISPRYPSFPHTLQRTACCCICPAWTMFWLGSIIDLTISVSCEVINPVPVVGITKAFVSVLLAVCLSIFSNLVVDFNGDFSICLGWGAFHMPRSLSFNPLTSFEHCRPFNWSSSAIARKVSRLSW